jgi:hypothetical protein
MYMKLSKIERVYRIATSYSLIHRNVRQYTSIMVQPLQDNKSNHIHMDYVTYVISLF